MRSPFARSPSLLLAVLASSFGVADVRAQCAATWSALDGAPGTNGFVSTTVTWDPDGSGPANPVVVVGGNFSSAGSVSANNLALYDPSAGSWSSLGSGTNGWVYSLAVMPNGDLVVGGTFSTISGVAASCIASWNGTTWSPLGLGLDGVVHAIVAAPGGNLFASGAFRNAGGSSANRVAKWDGANWSPLGSGLGILASGSDRVDCLALLPNGDLVAGGQFSQSGSTSVRNIARWNGTSWSSFGSGATNGLVGNPTCFLVLPNGSLVVGGSFSSAAGVTARNIAVFNGVTWSPLGTGLDAFVNDLVLLPSGRILAGGVFTFASGVPVLGMGEWDGVNWVQFGAWTRANVADLEVLPNGDVLAAWQFEPFDPLPWNRMARWNGVSWSPVGTGFDNSVEDLAVLPNGDVIAAGRFRMAGASMANRIARRAGGVWGPLGAGMDGNVLCLHVLPNGHVLAGGEFLTAGGVTTNYIARWDGTRWLALGSGVSNTVRCIASLPNGDVVVGGDFATAGGVAVNYVARWDGANWSALGSGSGIGLNGGVTSLLVRSNGDLVVGGQFSSAGGVSATRIASWNGTNWAAAYGGLSGPSYAMLEMPNGDLVVGGFIQSGFPASTPLAYLARWNGVRWANIGVPGVNNPVHDVALLPNRDLVVAGDFNTADGSPAMRVARWDGSAWHAMDTGTDYGVRALEVAPNGSILIGGEFQTAAGRASAHFGEMTQPCPATATVAGSSCPGSGGPVSLEAISLPWIGSSFGARAAGFPQLSVGFWMLGTTTVSLPASVAHPAALPGCQLFTMGDLGTGFLSPSAGAAVVRVEVPRDPILVGLAARMQVASIELDAQSNITAIASSNAIDFMLGRF